MHIIEVMDDAALLAPAFRGASWTSWRAFLAALFGLPMDEAARALFHHHTGRSTPPMTAFREAALVCGRRGGKSRVLALVAVYLACFRDYAPYLAPGEIATVAIIAADRRQARSIFRFILGTLKGNPLLADMIETETSEEIRLTNRVQIEIATASFRVTRGYSFAAVLADETAFWRDESGANPDTEILAALRPGLSTLARAGSMLLLASSPYAKRGALYQTYKTHWGKENGRVLVWRGTTAEMNPSIDPAVIAEAYESDPASASAEYGAEFRNDIAAFVSREVVEDVVVAGRRELPPLAGVKYHAFVDPSGGSADSMTLAIAHTENNRAVLDAVREVRPPFSPEAVVAGFSALLKSYRLHEVTGDRYAGEWPRERFQQHRITYAASERTKNDVYRDILPTLNSGHIELLDNTRLISQLCGLERRTARGGRDIIDHGPGAHDDLANAVAGALLLTAGGPSGYDTSLDWVGTATW